METATAGAVEKKSEILFFYETTYSIPNGDPFTGEQRYDDETKKILISDVRIKRFIRDYLKERGYEIYVLLDRSQASKEGKESGAAARIKALKARYPGIIAADVLRKCIDVRLFGGISTEEGDTVNLTGPVQFALLNPSLNEVDLRMHQNTCVFPSSIKNEQGTIGTTTVVPYAVNQIHGWLNPFTGKHTGLTKNDVEVMFKALWESVNLANTRTKSNQSSLLLLEIIYSKPNQKLYGVDRMAELIMKEAKRGEQLRSIEDYDFDFAALLEAAEKDYVAEVRYYCEIKKIKHLFEDKPKLIAMDLEKVRLEPGHSIEGA